MRPLTPARKRGVALLLVLGALVLLSAITVGFLAAVRQDRTASAFYTDGATARQHADTAINIAIAQIAEATSNPDEAWISQPGLLRTFSANGAVAAFKLYSSDTMKVSGEFNPANEVGSEVPNDWSSAARQHEFVDLNKPIILSEGGIRRVYPIVDAFANESAPAGPEVEGFEYDATTRGGGRLAGGTSYTKPSNEDANPLPMPVKWIYVLKDGSLASLTEATSSGVEAVARVAFWGDDETAKVNLNTASDGVYFDSPSYNTKQDMWMGMNQPVAQEYQRFPGHPATTSLAAVFKDLRLIPEDDTRARYPSPAAWGTALVPGPVNASRSRAAARLTPRISSNSMLNHQLEDGGSDGSRWMAWLQTTPVFPDSDRLYASVDEFSFWRNQTDKNWATPANPQPKDQIARVAATLPTDGIGAERAVDMTQKYFFTTTDSRAPELNLLNRPRITLWPFNKELVDPADWSGLTPEDRLIRFASEVGSNKRKLFFQRSDAWSKDNDYVNIQDNKDLYSYLQYMTSQALPTTGKDTGRTGGVSGNFSAKYTPVGRDQILTEMFDYLRSMVNQFNYSYRPVAGPIYAFPQQHVPDTSGFFPFGSNDITPLEFVPEGGSTDTRGLGSVPVLTEVHFQFYNAGEFLEGQLMEGDQFSDNYGYLPPDVPPEDVSPPELKYPKEATQPYSVSRPWDIRAWTGSGWTGTEAAPTPDDKPDYVIRRVRMTCLLNFISPLNTLQTANARFQVHIRGTPFGIYIPSTSPVQVRRWRPPNHPMGLDAWSNHIADIGFPSTAGTTALVANFGGDHDDNMDGYGTGGQYSAVFPMMFPEEQYAGHSDTINQTQVKAFANDSGNGGTAQRYSNSLAGTRVITGNDQRLAQTYPFVSDVLEFRIPYTSSSASMTDESPFRFQLYNNDGSVSNKDANGNPRLPAWADTPEVTFSGSGPGLPRNLRIELYRGLKKDGAGNYTDRWTKPNEQEFDVHSIEDANLLMKTDIEVADCTIPLPRLGDLTPVSTNSWEVFAYSSDLGNWPRNTNKFWPLTQPRGSRTATSNYRMVLNGTSALDLYPSFKDFQWYPQRFRHRYKDRIFLAGRPVAQAGLDTVYPFANKMLDVFRSYHLSGTTGSMGDLRLASLKKEIPKSWWQHVGPAYGEGLAITSNPSYVAKAGFFWGEELISYATANYGATTKTWYDLEGQVGRFVANKSFAARKRILSPSVNGLSRRNATGGNVGVGDFTLGFGSFAGGAGVVGPDSGAISMGWTFATLTPNSTGPYYAGSLGRAAESGTNASTYHRNFYGITLSPWKQMPSAIPFGTLPSRATEPSSPWETLLFAPNPDGGASTHRGWAQAPRDHLLLDLFYMPVVEPYAITENFATNGKINLNYQLAPFTYIMRKTGMYALMRNLKINAVPDVISGTQQSTVFKPGADAKYQASSDNKYRLALNVDETLKGFDERFSANDPFISSSEITEMFLVPQGTTYGSGGATIKSYWNDKNLTGDDKKEAPYNHLLPRVTTRSNSFKIHFIAQTIKGKAGEWNVTGQFRGSQIVERYLDIKNREYGTSGAPDDKFPALAGMAPDGEPYYRFRKLGIQQFSP